MEQLREHGGLSGIRDETALESALARPQQKWHDAEMTDISSLAAAYGFGLTMNHPYRDGNKRIGFLARDGIAKRTPARTPLRWSGCAHLVSFRLQSYS